MSAAVSPALVEQLRAETPRMLELLRLLVDQDSPSSDVDLLRRGAEVTARVVEDVLGSAPEVVELAGKPHVVWHRGSPRVLLLGHFDTVWPAGTVARWPYSSDGTRATGPGIFDMKGGVVQALFAAAAAGVPEGVAVLFTSDEEIGAGTSRELIEDLGGRAAAVLVLEPALDGALKIARKGVAGYRILIEGQAAHASMPEQGANATEEMAHVALFAAGLADPERGTTCTPTLAEAGTAANTIPAQAVLTIDSRAATLAEQDRIHEAISGLRPSVAGTSIRVEGGPNRGPMPEEISRDLFQRALRLGAGLGLPPLEGVLAPGGSDGQFTAALGTPTLDGLGAVGARAHAEGEYLEIAAMPERAALVAALLTELLGGD